MTKLSITLPAIVTVLGASWADADSSFTATNWIAGVPVPGISCTNGQNQVFLKGNVHVVRLESADSRINGRMQAGMNLAYQADGTATFGGSAYAEVGTWDASGTKFTPGGGVWDLNYTGLAQADGSDQIRMVGYGLGGAIEGLRVECNVRKGPGTPFDPAIPYTADGVIKPAAVDERVRVDDFEDGVLNGQWTLWSSGSPFWAETNAQLTVGGAWNRPADEWTDHAGAYWKESWSVPDGQTIEWRVEVLAMNQDASGVGFGVGTANKEFYKAGLYSDRAIVERWKLMGGVVSLSNEAVAIRQTNVVLSFAVTRRQSEALLTFRVLDSTNSQAVLYESCVTDTAPYLAGGDVALAVEAKTNLASPVVSARFDNFERWTYEVPRVATARAVRLSWPATGMSFLVEGARKAEGPYVPVQDDPQPGFEQITLPMNGLMEFWRLRHAP